MEPDSTHRRKPSGAGNFAWLPWIAAIVAIFIAVGIVQRGGTQPVPYSGRVTDRVRLAAIADKHSYAQMWMTNAPDGKHLFIEFAGLKQTVGKQVYQVWLLNKGGAPYSCGVFTPTKAGTALFACIVPDQVYTIIAVTLEPQAIDAVPLGPRQFVGFAPTGLHL